MSLVKSATSALGQECAVNAMAARWVVKRCANGGYRLSISTTHPYWHYTRALYRIILGLTTQDSLQPGRRGYLVAPAWVRGPKYDCILSYVVLGGVPPKAELGAAGERVGAAGGNLSFFSAIFLLFTGGRICF